MRVSLSSIIARATFAASPSFLVACTAPTFLLFYIHLRTGIMQIIVIRTDCPISEDSISSADGTKTRHNNGYVVVQPPHPLRRAL